MSSATLTRPETATPCTGADPEIFHDDTQAAAARKVCAGCPLADYCRTQARDNREWGTWGGETSAERAAAGHPPAGWRGRGHKIQLKPCGTTAAYRRHLRAGQKPCRACKTAEYVRRAERTAARTSPRRHPTSTRKQT
ncbi:WhiB family transcriptional regulator [Streptomyces sp. NPDC048638]|uniref:WhiB family transcriptional regulator n=1 Tax=Streptomyces sp. NPDC048638 TaxID=3365580 RepID=UPI003718F48D